MNTQKIKTAAAESTERWDGLGCKFVTQDLGRYSVKFSAPCIGGGVTLNCSHITNALNSYDAVANFVRQTRVMDGIVYGVEEIEPVRTVCLSTTGFRFVPKGKSWLCLDTEVIVNVADEGSIYRGDDGELVKAYGKLTRI